MDPIGMLMKEHQLIERAVEVTKRFRDTIQSEEHIRPKRYWMLVDVWSTYADIVHHGKEEQQLFPRLETQQASPETVSRIDRLVEEHMKLLRYISEMRRYARPMFTGEEAARARVLNCLNEYLTLVIPHMRMEDEELFPLVPELLSKRELNELAKAFLAMDARTGPNVHKFYAKRVESILKE